MLRASFLQSRPRIASRSATSRCKTLVWIGCWLLGRLLNLDFKGRLRSSIALVACGGGLLVVIRVIRVGLRSVVLAPSVFGIALMLSSMYSSTSSSSSSSSFCWKCYVYKKGHEIRRWKVGKSQKRMEMKSKSKRILNTQGNKRTVKCSAVVDVEFNTFPWCWELVVELQFSLEDPNQANQATF